MSIELRILGPLVVVAEGQPIALGGRKQRALLALLALHANELVSSDRLLEEIWPDSEPGAAAPSLHVYVSQLRKALGDSAVALETRSGGYALALAPEQLDAFRFERLLREARQALAAGEPEQAHAMFTEALSLWRGPALADLAYESFAEREGARLEELRLEALESRLEAELQLGRHAELISELEELVQTDPLRERLRGQLMLALYRSGRQAESLETYREGREALVAELGLEPGPELKELEAAILRHDSSLVVEPPELRARRHLPAPATPLIGRRREVEEVVSLLRGGTRLLTLTGAGGTGKTRLGLVAAHELAEHFRDGVYFVGLAPLREPGLVPSAIARVLGIKERPGQSPLESVKAYVGERTLLLLVDNLEHLAEAAPFLSELLAEGSGLKLLVTSRSRLRLYGEQEYPVPPLELPDQERLPDVDALAQVEAVALFCARAQAVEPSFALSDGNASAVAELCLRLDGLPLALELAAARSGERSPQEMLEALPLELATEGPRDVPARQQTLRSTIEWSYGLLDRAEQTLLARLSVLAGGCTLETAERVCDANLDQLASLVGANLVSEEADAAGEPRFSLLETIREYAAERLEESADADSWRKRHAEHFLALAAEAEPEVFGPNQSWWLERLETEHGNLGAARIYLHQSGKAELALELVVSIARFLRFGGRLTEARMWLDEALAEADQPTNRRVQALLAASTWALSQGDYDLSHVRVEEALALAHRLGDASANATALSLLGTLSSLEGDDDRAMELHGESLALFRELGDEQMITAATAYLGQTALYRRDYDRAIELLEQSLALARSAQSTRDAATMLAQLGLAAVGQSRLSDAGTLLTESLVLAEQVPSIVLWSLEGVAALAAVRGEAERAARILGASDSLAEDVGVPLIEIPFVRTTRERTVATARGELGELAFDAAAAEGRAMTLEEAVAYALAGNAGLRDTAAV